MKKLAFLFIALFSAATFAQELPKIAVYVTGDVPNNEKEALGTRMLASLVNSGRYIAIERSNSFLAEIEKEHVKQRSGAIDDNQISELGKQFGVKFVCIAAITPAFGEFQVSARIVDVETAVVVYIGESASPLKSMADLANVSDQVVRNMFSRQTSLEPQPRPQPAGSEELKPSILPTTVATTVVSRNDDLYFTWRYLPVASPVYWSLSAYNVEFGRIYGNGVFWGFDFGFAAPSDFSSGHLGFGINLGKSLELAPEFNLALGGSLGLWFTGDDNTGNESFNWIGPLVRLRYNIFELSYKVLFGTEESYVPYDSEPSSGIVATNQVGVGLCFEGTSGRFGQPKYDYYFAIKYLPIASPVYVSPIAYNIEYGWVWGDGAFSAIDFGYARGYRDDGLYGVDWHVGGGFNLGKSFELAPQISLALGSSLGFWSIGEREKVKREKSWYNDYGDYYYNYVYSVLFFGPFVRLRYGVFELSYKALFGNKYKEESSGIGFSNQVGIGLYFEGKKRHK